jgi:hypothetical protein
VLVALCWGVRSDEWVVQVTQNGRRACRRAGRLTGRATRQASHNGKRGWSLTEKNNARLIGETDGLKKVSHCGGPTNTTACKGRSKVRMHTRKEKNASDKHTVKTQVCKWESISRCRRTTVRGVTSGRRAWREGRGAVVEAGRGS